MSTALGDAALLLGSGCAERLNRRPNALQSSLLPVQLFLGIYMKKLLAMLVASMFAAGAVYADEMKKDEKKTEMKKEEKKGGEKKGEKKAETKKEEKKDETKK